MEIDIDTTSDNGDFLVLYSDTSNNAAMTATAGQVLPSSGKPIRTSPDFVLNSGNDQLSTVYSWGALAAGDTTAYSSQTAILTALSNDKDCTTDATYVELLDDPAVLCSISCSATNANTTHIKYLISSICC